jgi:hypothetical protein
VQRHLAAKGLKVATGTIVDATIINAPSSTKNADKARDPEMHQTKKGLNQTTRSEPLLPAQGKGRLWGKGRHAASGGEGRQKGRMRSSDCVVNISQSGPMSGNDP